MASSNGWFVGYAVWTWEKNAMEVTEEEIPKISILYQDDALIVINKPSGIAVHRGWDRDKYFAMTLTRDMIGQYVYPVHRLDKPTSGALIFLLESSLVAPLQTSFQEGDVQKHYITLTRGVAPEEGIFERQLRSKGKSEGPYVDAMTTFRRHFVFENRYSVVSAFPKTGRLHQIRRHFKQASLHLIGDVKYGKGEHNRIFRERFDLHRLALHALEITFPHPVSGEMIHIYAPPPDDIHMPFARMGVPEDIWKAQLG
ncbi:MAG TPA: pseudouridylate synthase [Myxococcales bacterium]|nr:pseudouridylate synthase [Deltaproteobacteria bacterium]MBU47678.1 pseudouridylate synthase [Deltaproteobacteria bacterium]HAA56989.1 pseudouridylate synthase [Myxococcales bacterium]|tara:strand:- start:8511 stop:9278 length:768 start_codon:yes stop_codon:yes gene_type:complete